MMAAYAPKDGDVDQVAGFLTTQTKTQGDKLPKEGTDVFQQIFPEICSSRDCKAITFDNINEELEKHLADAVKAARCDEVAHREVQGMLGPADVHFDTVKHVGTWLVDADKLGVTSHSNFSTVRANKCVYKGKWVYEVMLGSKGVMQLGWCTNKCQFTQEEGVGDTSNSYAYDGNRLRKWNVKTYKYGQTWLTGDVITCAMDCDIGTVSYSRNGIFLGEAFDNVQTGPGMAYFPAMSLSLGENIRVNFGSTPLRYPMEGYLSLQRVPLADLVRADLMLTYFERLLPELTSKSLDEESVILLSTDPGLGSDSEQLKKRNISKTSLMLITSHVLEKLAPLFMNGYIVESCLLRLLLRYCDFTEPLAEKPVITEILNTLWIFLEDFEIECCLKNLAISLLTMYRFSPVSLDFHHQRKYLTLTLCLVRHDSSRHYLLKSVLFDKIKFPIFLHIKPPDDEMLAQMFPTVWWQYIEKNDETRQCYSTKKTDLENVEAKQIYFEDCYKLQDRVRELETIQVDIVKCLLKTSDGQDSQQTSCSMFLLKLRDFLKENMLTGHSSLQPLQCPLPVILCFLHRLLTAWRQEWSLYQQLHPDTLPNIQHVFVPCHYFYDEDGFKYWDLQRFGGLVSHLNKTYKKDVLSDQQATSGESNKFIHSSDDKLKCLIEILDSIVLLYNSAKLQVKKMSVMRDSGDEVMIALKETVDKLDRCPEELPDVRLELEKARKVLENKLIDQGRQLAWVRAVIYSQDKRDDIAWLNQVVLRTISTSSQRASLFGFVPELYMEVCLHAFQAITQYFHPTTDFESFQGHEELTEKFALLVVSHFADARIVNSDLKDSIVQSLANFCCFTKFMKVLEGIQDDIKENMVKSLLEPYEHRSWAQTNIILLKIWKGNGYAFRYTNLPHLTTSRFQSVDLAWTSIQSPCPSRVFQELIGQTLERDKDQAVSFLDSLLNQLNWSFSEFIGMLQELQSVISRPGMPCIIDSRQLKICATCFEIAVALLRVLEMVVSVCPQVFLDWGRPSAEQLLARLFQSLCQVMNRVTSKSNLFEMIVSSGLPGLEPVDHFPIVTASLGIFIQLILKTDPVFQKRAIAALLVDPGFQFSDFEFTLTSSGSDGQGMAASSHIEQKVFHLRKYKEVSQQEIADAESLIQYLKQQNIPTEQMKAEGSEEDLCTICYAKNWSCVFRPCRHQSCRSCISHHMMNKSECFFCKTIIEQVEDRHGNVIPGLQPQKKKKDHKTRYFFDS